jgi:hypothetical protein
MAAPFVRLEPSVLQASDGVARQGSRMRSVRLIGWSVLAFAVGLCLVIATADDAEIASLDPHHPATYLPLVASRWHTVQSYVRDFRASDLIDTATAGFRERIRRESPIESPAP